MNGTKKRFRMDRNLGIPWVAAAKVVWVDVGVDQAWEGRGLGEGKWVVAGGRSPSPKRQNDAVPVPDGSTVDEKGRGELQ